MSYTFMINTREGPIMIIGGAKNDGEGIGIFPNGHIIHIPPRQDKQLLEAMAIFNAGYSLTEAAQQIKNEQVKQHALELVTKMVTLAREQVISTVKVIQQPSALKETV